MHFGLTFRACTIASVLREGAVRGFPALRAPAHFWIGAPRSEAYFFSIPRMTALHTPTYFHLRIPRSRQHLRSALRHFIIIVPRSSPILIDLFNTIIFELLINSYPRKNILWMCLSVSLLVSLSVCFSECGCVCLSFSRCWSVSICVWVCIFVHICESESLTLWFWVGVAISLCDSLFFRFKTLCPLSLY